MVTLPRLADCIARPTKQGQLPFYLIPHLETVAAGTGDKEGSNEARLGFLAGLSHDIAKAARDWQVYINDDSIQRGPPHAPLGAVLFSFWADQLNPKWAHDDEELDRLNDSAIDWARVIYRHHGALDDLEDRPPWSTPCYDHEQPQELLRTCHQADIDALVQSHFPEYDSDLSAFEGWFNSFNANWEYRQGAIRNDDILREFQQTDRVEELAVRTATYASRLIFADRLHAGDWDTACFEMGQAAPAIARHAALCEAEKNKAREDGAAESLIEARALQQQNALANYRANIAEEILTLLLPTGYGKTLTGLRIALEAIAAGRCKRIIYVAPYISILSQATKDIEDATGIKPFLHHHMSVIGLKDRPTDDAQAEDHQSFDLLDSWQAPIIATTFNQLFLTQFPARAQHCVKIPALDDAFVFIDEPQAIGLEAWCAFLRSLALTAETRRTQFLFTTATLPPMNDGIGKRGKVLDLIVNAKPVLNRYRIDLEPEPWRLDKVVEETTSSLGKVGSVALIQNTVRDAIDCYRGIVKAAPDQNWQFLAGPMLSTHKRQRIADIRKLLKQGDSVGVVCTQVLEAGVNLSFRKLFRAFAYFSSIGQAAGRANRHGEGELAEVIVFKFLREDDDEPVQRVYKDTIMYKNTGSILNECGSLDEQSFGDALSQYYQKCWEQNPRMTSLNKFERAAMGAWSELAKIEPFESYPSAEIFVPESEAYFDDDSIWKVFQCDTALGLLDRFRDTDFKRKLSFFDRKRLSAALRLFTVSVPNHVALKIGESTQGIDWLSMLKSDADYSPQTGLAHHYLNEETG